jgi:hypothetical protein
MIRCRVRDSSCPFLSHLEGRSYQGQFTSIGKIEATGDLEMTMGGKTCVTCRHGAREAIDKAIVAGEPLRDIAGCTRLSKSSLDRHKQDHLSATLVKAAETSDLAHGGKLLRMGRSNTAVGSENFGTRMAGRYCLTTTVATLSPGNTSYSRSHQKNPNRVSPEESRRS